MVEMLAVIHRSRNSRYFHFEWFKIASSIEIFLLTNRYSAVWKESQ